MCAAVVRTYRVLEGFFFAMFLLDTEVGECLSSPVSRTLKSHSRLLQQELFFFFFWSPVVFCYCKKS